jgi:cytochrome o ubiquinol oxidase operon protein cyoD
VSDERRTELRTYAIGYCLSLLLTGGAFAAVYWSGWMPGATLGIVFGLGLAQMVVHFRCFLHVGLKGSARDALPLILLSTLIIALMVSGTLVILLNLHSRLM